MITTITHRLHSRITQEAVAAVGEAVEDAITILLREALLMVIAITVINTIPT